MFLDVIVVKEKSHGYIYIFKFIGLDVYNITYICDDWFKVYLDTSQLKVDHRKGMTYLTD